MVLVDLYDQAQKDVLTACSNTPASSVAYSIHLPPPMPTFHVGDDIIEARLMLKKNSWVRVSFEYLFHLEFEVAVMKGFAASPA